MSEIKVGEYRYAYTLTDEAMHIKCLDCNFRGSSSVGATFAPMRDWREVAQKTLYNHFKDHDISIYELGEIDKSKDMGGFERWYKLIKTG